MSETCSTCQFWLPWQSTDADGKPYKGNCKVTLPPLAVCGGGNPPSSMYREPTPSSYYCVLHQKKEISMKNKPETHPWALNPWQPMSDPIDIAHLGKLIEELNEAGSASARCLIQGIDEKEPITGKLNREWLEDELADVLVNLDLVVSHFGLNWLRMAQRIEAKQKHLKAWHATLKDPENG
jgi:hypothetical protein